MSNLYKRKEIYKVFKCLAALLIIVLSIAIFYGCSTAKNQALKNPAIDEISEKTKQAGEYPDMLELDAKKLQKLYNIQPEEVEEYRVFIPMNATIKADELAIIKLKNPSDADSIKGKINQRITQQSDSFKSYIPDEYYLIEKNVLKVKGNYILFAVSKNVDKVEDTFDSLFK